MFSLTFAGALITYYNNKKDEEVEKRKKKRRKNKCNNRTIELRQKERVSDRERERDIEVVYALKMSHIWFTLVYQITRNMLSRPGKKCRKCRSACHCVCVCVCVRLLNFIGLGTHTHNAHTLRERVDIVFQIKMKIYAKTNRYYLALGF